MAVRAHTATPVTQGGVVHVAHGDGGDVLADEGLRVLSERMARTVIQETQALPAGGAEQLGRVRQAPRVREEHQGPQDGQVIRDKTVPVVSRVCKAGLARTALLGPLVLPGLMAKVFVRAETQQGNECAVGPSRPVSVFGKESFTHGNFFPCSSE
jgi:hypothetical protein